MHILAIEPYYGGSHRSILDNWRHWSSHTIDCLTRPASHWSLRLATEGPELGAEIEQKLQQENYDAVWFSSMANVCDLLAFAPSLHRVPKVYYFHEFQLSYPDNPRQKQQPHQQSADLNYALIQLYSAALCQRVLFNSQYLRERFIGESQRMLAHFPIQTPAWMLEPGDGTRPTIVDRSAILYPGLEPTQEDRHRPPGDKLRVLWNHRWEFDKQPREVFHLLEALGDREDFVLELAGPGLGAWRKAHPDLPWDDPRIRFHGELPPAQYRELLVQADVVFSAALQENFGLSVAEAVLAGAVPLVPDRLVYPELYPEVFLYSDVAEIPAKLTHDWLHVREDYRAALQEKLLRLRWQQHTREWDAQIESVQHTTERNNH